MSLDLAALHVYVRVAELGSFTRAAEQLGMPKARASALVQKLEAALGTRLLQRSTRVVRVTPEGEQLLQRARALLVDADEVASLFHAGRVLRGRVRLELPVIIARDFVIPRLPELFARHPQLVVDLRASDRIATAIKDGFDIVLRIGPVDEPGLVGRRLGEVPMMNCASPGYLRQRGTPRTLDDLQHHLIVHYATDAAAVFEYRDGDVWRELPMQSVITVDNFDAYEAACVAGLGIVQVPRHVEHHGNRLVEVLPELTARPVAISLLHTHGRAPPRRVRAVMGWLTEVLAPIVDGSFAVAPARAAR